MKTVFVSYAHDEALWLRQVLTSLETPLKDLVNIWVDYSLVEGEAFVQELQRQVQLADGFLVIVSEKYLTSEFVRDHEWPWIQQALETGENKKLFWLPQDVDPDQKESSSILQYLSQREIGYGKWETLKQLLAKDPRSNAALNNALLSLMERMRDWAGLEKPTNSQPTPMPEFDDEKLPDIQRRYLDAIIKSCRNINIGSLKEPGDKNAVVRLPLEKVYISLQADPTTIKERLETRALYHEMASFETTLDDSGSLQDRLANIIRQREAHIPSRAETADNTAGSKLEAVFHRERVLVILGDPGSGKSVLCRWLAMQMANAMQNRVVSGKERLGPPRLPILLRIAKFAEFLKTRYAINGGAPLLRKADHSEDLYRFLGDHPEDSFLAAYLHKGPGESPSVEEKYSTAQALGALCRKAVETQQAVLLVDGLDEVIDADLRGMVCDAMEHFIAEKVMPRPGNYPGHPTPLSLPGEAGGNQVVLTSRITGYHLAPLRLESAAHFLIRPLDDEQVADLCHKVGQVIDDNDRTKGTGEKLLVTIQNRPDHALERLKRNPLLLTALFSYFVSHRNLPTTRVELYRKLTLDLARRWGLTDADGRHNQHIATSLAQKIRDFLQGQSDAMRDVFLMKLLATVAMTIHESSSAGRITRSELESVFESELRHLIGVDPYRDEDADFFDYAKQLANLVAERLGILVELATNVFGFLHLTFQEYLVGWKLLHDALDNGPTFEENLLTAFIERLDDARWREPLLFAFGELAQIQTEGDAQAELLARLRLQLAVALPRDEYLLFMADLLDEMDTRRPAGAAWREVLLALLQGYARCGLRVSTASRRARLAEKIAELRRRRSDDVLQICLDALHQDDRLACPIAHLFWQRKWLPEAVLAAFAERQALDSQTWGWPMHTALRQNLSANRHLDAKPLEKLATPNEEKIFELRLYEAGFSAWQQQAQAFNERDWVPDRLPADAFPLRLVFSQEPHWAKMANNPACLRLIAGLLGAVDDLEAIRWMSEYRWIAEFLQGADSQRNQRLLATPEDFVPRWGVEDTIYGMAVYLDTNPDGRFKRQQAIPKLGAEFIAMRLPPPLEQVFQQAARTPIPAQTLTEGLQTMARKGDPDSCAAALVGLLLIGVELSGKPSTECLDFCRRAAQGLRDAALRGAHSQAKQWFGLEAAKDETPADIAPVPWLDDMQTSLIYRRVVDAAISALNAPLALGKGGHNQMRAMTQAYLWSYGFSRQQDDFVYNFAVLLDSAGPQASGWNSALPLLSRILVSPNLRYVPSLESAYYPPFWGIVPGEKLIPPAFFQSVERLAWAAGDFNVQFALGFGELFLEHLPNTGICGLQKQWTLFLLGFDPRESGADPQASPRLDVALLTHARQFGERMYGAVIAGDGDWQGLLQEPNLEDALMRLELAFSDGGLAVNDKTSEECLQLAERLAASNPFDACLFLARNAQHAPDETAQAWWVNALGWLTRVDDAYAKAEFLHRLRQVPGELATEAERLRQSLHTQLAGVCPILSAYAQGRLGRYLCRTEFPWNAVGALGNDPSWVVVSTYAALTEVLEENHARQNFSRFWQALSAAPDAAKVDDLLEQTGANALECNAEALSTLQGMTKQPQSAALHWSRLVSLLTRPASTALPLLQNWLAHSDDSPNAAILQRQAALLLAERNRSLAPELVAPLFALREFGDDIAATRAEIALASPLRNVDREQRRFSLSKHGLEVVKRLAEQEAANRKQPGRRYLSRCAGLALNDWQFDDQDSLKHWCEQAAPASEAETLLLHAVIWVDIWSKACQEILYAWLLAAEGSAGEKRHNSLVQWAGRLEILKNITLETAVLDALNHIPTSDPIRQLRCFSEADNQHSEYITVLAVLKDMAGRFYLDVDSLFPEAEQHLANTLVPLFPKGNQGGPDKAILNKLGAIQYSPIGEYPEDCMLMVLPYLNQPLFIFALMRWLHGSLCNYSIHSDNAQFMIERRKVEALLSFAVCFSERSPNTFAREADKYPDFLIQLTRICYMTPSRRSHMAAVTLISRLKSVKLDSQFELEGKTFSVLDALLYGLHGDGEVQRRLAEVLPEIKSLRGGSLIKQIGDMICGAAVQPRGSVVLAAAQLLQRLLHGSSLTANERREAASFLRDAANATQNRRPLYRQVGTGNDGDPITVVYAGDLAEELAGLAASTR